MGDIPDGLSEEGIDAILAENSASADAMMAAAKSGQKITMTVRDLCSPSRIEGSYSEKTDATPGVQ